MRTCGVRPREQCRRPCLREVGDPPVPNELATHARPMPRRLLHDDAPHAPVGVEDAGRERVAGGPC
jgi:hypothetical protein